MTRHASDYVQPPPTRPAEGLRHRVVVCALLTAGLLGTTAATATSELTGMSLEDLMAVNVVGASRYAQTQREVAAAVSVITRDEIKAFGWRTIDEALASLPGIFATYDRQYSFLGVRGFGTPGDYTTRVLIAINGNRFNEPVYDGGPTGRTLPLDMSLIERIEFIPGPGGAVYGQNAMLGVVNIVTRTGQTVDGAEVAVSYRWPQAERTARATWGKLLDNDVEVLVSMSGLASRGEDHFYDFGEAGVRGTARGMDGERDADFNALISRGPWKLEFMHGDRRKDDPTASFMADPLKDGQKQRDRYTGAQLQYRDQISDDLTLSARLYGTDYRYEGRFFYDGAPYGYTSVSEQRGIELQLISTAFAGHTLSFGAEYRNEGRIDQYVRDLTDRANDTAMERDGSRAGLYVQDEWRLTDTLSSTTGLRIDRNRDGDIEVSPRLGLIWAARPDTTLKALLGRAHREPNAYERDYEEDGTQAANPDLDGESIDTVELVVDHAVSEQLHLRAALYRWQIDDMIRLGEDPASGLPQFQSAGRARAKGLELSASHSWRTGARLRTSLALQELETEYGDKVENSPEVLAKLNFSTPVPHTSLRVGYELRHDGSRYNGVGDKIPGYWLSNLHLVAERWAKGLEVSLSVLNLFDREYAHPSAIPRLNWQRDIEQDGRSVRLGLEYRF